MNFSYEKNGRLTYIFNENNGEDFSVLANDVLIYDYQMIYNIAHIIYLNKNGDLVYCQLSNQDITKNTIAKFDTSSNHYNKVALLIINGKLHIFYSFSNMINSNIYTLHHIIYNKEMEDRFNIMRFVSNKVDYLFSVANDRNGNIHLLYNTNSNGYSNIFYTYFNSFNKHWLNNPIKVSDENELCERPYLFFDQHESIHGIWWQRKKNNYMMKYSRLNIQGHKKSKWQTTIIPNLYSDDASYQFSFFNNVISIDTGVRNIISKDLGISWQIVKNENSQYKLEANKQYVNPSINNVESISVNNENKNVYPKDQLDKILHLLEELLLAQNEIISEQMFLREKIIEAEKSINNTSKPSFFNKLFMND